MCIRDRYGGGKSRSNQESRAFESSEDRLAREGNDGDEAGLWICAYANRQWSLHEDVTEDPSKTSFHKAMRLAFGTLALIDNTAKYFERVWCDYEIYISLTIKEEERHRDARRNPPPLPLDCRCAHEKRQHHGVQHGAAAAMFSV